MKTIPRLLLLFLATAVPCLGTAGEGVSELFGKVLRGSTRVPGCAGFPIFGLLGVRNEAKSKTPVGT